MKGQCFYIYEQGRIIELVRSGEFWKADCSFVKSVHFVVKDYTFLYISLAAVLSSISSTYIETLLDNIGLYLKLVLVTDILQEYLQSIDVVKMEVGEDNSPDGLGGDPPELGEDLPGRVGALHDIDDDQAILTLYHDTVGQAKANCNVNVVSESQHLLHGGYFVCVCQILNLLKPIHGTNPVWILFMYYGEQGDPQSIINLTS